MFCLNIIVFIDYKNVGCYKDTSSRAIPTLEGKDPILDGQYSSRKNPIAKCALAARKKGYGMFVIQDGGWCASSATARKTFNKYGKSDACRQGEGGAWANDVYVLQGKWTISQGANPFQSKSSHNQKSTKLLIVILLNVIQLKNQMLTPFNLCHFSLAYQLIFLPVTEY